MIAASLARAQRLHPVDICYPVFMSDHMRLCYRFQDAERLSDFMQYTNSNLAREVTASHGLGRQSSTAEI